MWYKIRGQVNLEDSAERAADRVRQEIKINEDHQERMRIEETRHYERMREIDDQGQQITEDEMRQQQYQTENKIREQQEEINRIKSSFREH